uniref:Uncharacterized protein n=1 Tax=Magnetospirillum gryphiswaldense TaxID=55518 RepID=A4TW34_9PROT|nr:hypothetical protein MGR_3768 [Magnetospirillum gryphiswaldense MSR-1]
MRWSPTRSSPKPEQRAGIEAVARRLGVPFAGLWLWTEPDLAARAH